ncbi:hypothetical protein SAMN05443574_103333 [Haloarcula vallismortis]|uniref:Uncharacterized protein n=1 Tax=Haloarcula vallismortis TaxID=28442 RepID=A0A1H2TPI1_HALVA|nr:hypothetical protein [Haloarcula vallismortis]SDW45790.1 hypothetical protein SAMN05443574_103333 [Haloarcula vallismortis]
MSEEESIDEIIQKMREESGEGPPHYAAKNTREIKENILYNFRNAKHALKLPLLLPLLVIAFQGWLILNALVETGKRLHSYLKR